ncbi:cytochrome P450 [Ktedonosporobacter rubrisoli]|nr:cytochrome P450 [Ktedonosporobacter rubrisoli]
MNVASEQVPNPFSWYRKMRREHPVVYDEQADVWHVFSYEDVMRILADHATFHKVLIPPEVQNTINPILSSVLQADPHNHRRLHNIVMQAFSPQVLTTLEPRISEIIDGLLEQVIVTGEMDVTNDLAYPLPVSVIADLLGIPAELHGSFKDWCDTIKREPTIETTNPKFQKMGEYFRQVLNDRRLHPQDDLVSALVAAEINGQRLSEDELLGFCVVLLASGTNSSTGLIGNAIFCFDEQPEVMDILRAEPELMSGAIEEVLRYRAPIQALRRTTKKEVVLGKQHISVQQDVVAWIGSANHDEAQFPDPENFDIRRRPNRHLAFAHSIHLCVGAPLARLVAKKTLNSILKRLSDIRRRRDIPAVPVRSAWVSGLKTLPITFKVSP